MGCYGAKFFIFEVKLTITTLALKAQHVGAHGSDILIWPFIGSISVDFRGYLNVQEGSDVISM
jgi:hypothetical protein